MPNIASAKKRVRTTAKRTAINTARKTRVRGFIRKVDLPDRGTYYRVRVGSWDSSNEAGAFCAKLKAAGGDCVISRN